MKKAFSLVELIVVIGIICILAGTLAVSFSGGAEKARAAKCMSNLRSLAMAAQEHRQAAGSYETMGLKVRLGGSVNGSYSEVKGWVSSDTQGRYPATGHQSFKPIGFNEMMDVKKREYVITNGWMYEAMDHDRGVYTCPSVRNIPRLRNILFSYFMNARFGWDYTQGGKPLISPEFRIAGEKSDNDRKLMFAEIPFKMGPKGQPGDWSPEGKDPTSTECDGVLQYKGCMGGNGVKEEHIGGNHKYGKYWCAHVVFADGHVEKLRVSGVAEDNLYDLTTWLCGGFAVGIDNGRWDRLDE